MSNKKIVIFESPDGYQGKKRSDNAGLGYRKDTLPIVDALRAKGWEAEVIFYTHEHRETIALYVKENAAGYIHRINPGNLNDEGLYMDMLRELTAAGVAGMPVADQMIGMGAKDALVKIKGTKFAHDDTYAYYTVSEFHENFPKSLMLNERVLKQNRGSTGEGIWRVQLIDELPAGATSVPLDARVKCTEAKDNHVEEHKLGAFMEFCDQYIHGDNGLLLDQRFLPRIKEGEIRLLMLDRTPVNVVHKKPAEGADAFSATLFSGAKYRYDEPSDWPQLIEPFLAELPAMNEKLGGYTTFPLIWTADFILDTAEDGTDAYVLGEMNCSCVGFTSSLGLAAEVADTAIAIIEANKNA